MAPLRLWEQVCSSMGVTYGFELKGKFDEAQLKEAWKLVQKEVPYARTVIRIVVGEIAFVEDPQLLPVEVVLGKALRDVTEEMVKSANTARDHGQGTFFFKLFSDETAKKHLLVVTMNHAGADANSGFRILQTLFAHIGNLSAGKPAVEGAPKATADVLGGMPAKFTAAALKLPAAYMPMLPALDKAAGASGTEAILGALSPEATAQLLSQCVDPPVPAEAVAAGCSLLWWPQQLAAGDKLWDVAAAASIAVRRERDAKGGLAFWKRLHADRTMAEANSTTLGVIPLQPQHGALRIASVYIMLAAYGAASPDEAGTYFMAHTFDNRRALSQVLASDAGEKATVADFLSGAGGLSALTIGA
ncbi:hypothetical protein WJX81_001702 [Elliptochloris bilobata]|uniref:Uncharacterized protein n=1 Tax=Elliptochloris bilobata TaxID=381761 RepID=A0AAW1RB13_9CHLO